MMCIFNRIKAAFIHANFYNVLWVVEMTILVWKMLKYAKYKRIYSAYF